MKRKEVIVMINPFPFINSGELIFNIFFVLTAQEKKCLL